MGLIEAATEIKSEDLLPQIAKLVNLEGRNILSLTLTIAPGDAVVMDVKEYPTRPTPASP